MPVSQAVGGPSGDRSTLSRRQAMKRLAAAASGAWVAPVILRSAPALAASGSAVPGVSQGESGGGLNGGTQSGGNLGSTSPAPVGPNEALGTTTGSGSAGGGSAPNGPGPNPTSGSVATASGTNPASGSTATESSATPAIAGTSAAGTTGPTGSAAAPSTFTRAPSAPAPVAGTLGATIPSGLSLPYTGFPAQQLVEAALALIAGGAGAATLSRQPARAASPATPPRD